MKDLFRSLVKTGLDTARERLDTVRPLGLLKRLRAQIRDQGSLITEAELTRSLTALSELESASVTVRRGALQIHASFVGREPLACEVTVEAVRFAPRGAKELVFRVSPEEIARHPQVRNVLGAISTTIAHGLWNMVIGRPGDSEQSGGAIVDRDGPNIFRTDLRSVPAVRAAMKRGTASMIIDTLSMSGVRMQEGELRLHVTLPGLFG